MCENIIYRGNIGRLVVNYSNSCMRSSSEIEKKYTRMISSLDRSGKGIVAHNNESRFMRVIIIIRCLGIENCNNTYRI